MPSLIATRVTPPVTKAKICWWMDTMIPMAMLLPSSVPGAGCGWAAARSRPRRSGRAASMLTARCRPSLVVEAVGAQQRHEDDQRGQEQPGEEDLGPAQRPPAG